MAALRTDPGSNPQPAETSASASLGTAPMGDALRRAQPAVYLIDEDVRNLQCKAPDKSPSQSKAQEECHTFRIKIPDKMVHRVIMSARKTLQSGGVCVAVRSPDGTALHVHSSLPLDGVLQALRLQPTDVAVQKQAVYFFTVLGATSDVERTVEEALACEAIGGFITAAAMRHSTLALFTTPAPSKPGDAPSELFTVALAFERHHCPLLKALPSAKPYRLGVFGTWCTSQTLFRIKAGLEDKLADVGPTSITVNPGGRSVAVLVTGLENAIKARAKVLSALWGLGYRCAPRANRVLLIERSGPHVDNLYREIHVDGARAKAGEYKDLLDPQIATPNPDPSLVRTSVLNTIRNLGYDATTGGGAELVFSLHGVKCVGCARTILQAIQDGPHQYPSGYLNLYRNQLTLTASDDVVEDAIPEVIKALRKVSVQAELIRVSHDLSEEPDPGTEEECAVLRRLTGRTPLRKDVGDEASEIVSDDSEMLRSQNSPVTTAAFHVTGLSCPSCALLLRGTVKAVLPGVTSCAIDFPSRTLYVSYGSESVSVEEIRERLGALGHTAAFLREGEDLRLKLTDTLWANENAVSPPPPVDARTQAARDARLLLYELHPLLSPPDPILEPKHYTTLEETVTDAAPGGEGDGEADGPTYRHLTTVPVLLAPDLKGKDGAPAYLSVFSQPILQPTRDGPPEIPRAVVFLVAQPPTAFAQSGRGDPAAAASLLVTPDPLAAPSLPLAQRWTAWFDVTVDTKEKGAEDALRPLGTVGTVQELWRIWSKLCISNLRDGCNLRLFRHDVPPSWEHPLNRGGGRWSARSLGKGRRLRLWTQTVFALVGGQLQDTTGHRVLGVCLSSKPGGDRIEVWVDGGSEAAHAPPAAEDPSAGDTMDEVLRKLLFPDEDKKYFFYQSHQDYNEQRKTQRGGRRAKTRKSGPYGDTYSDVATDDGQYPHGDYYGTPPASTYGGGGGSGGGAYGKGGGGGGGGYEAEHRGGAEYGGGGGYGAGAYPPAGGYGGGGYGGGPGGYGGASAYPGGGGYPPAGKGGYGADPRGGGPYGGGPGGRFGGPMGGPRFPMAHAHPPAPYYGGGPPRGKGYDGGYEAGHYEEDDHYHAADLYEGGKGYGPRGYGRAPPFAPPLYGGYGPPPAAVVGKGGGPPPFPPYAQGERSPLYPPMSAPLPPTMTPGEADNILAMHSMTGSGLSASAPPWPLTSSLGPSVVAAALPGPEEEDDDDPTVSGMEVGQLLEELHLEQYVPVMAQKGYEDWSSIQDLQEADLAAMGFKPGHSKRLLASLRAGN